MKTTYSSLAPISGEVMLDSSQILPLIS